MVTNTSYIYQHGPEVNTQAVVSQKVRIFGYDNDKTATTNNSPDKQIGVMSSFSVNENRSIEELHSVGIGDRIAELVPGLTGSATISVNRMALWLANLFQSFGYKSGIDGVVRSLRHHRWPFDIRQELVFSDLVGENQPLNNKGITDKSKAEFGQITPQQKALVTFYEGCWMESYGITFSSDSAMVAENCSIKVSDIVAEQPPTKFDNEDYLSSNRRKAFRVRSII